MKLRLTAAALSLLVAAVPALASQHTEHKPDAAPAAGGMSEADMKAMAAAGTPGPEHEALAKFAGDWTFTNKFWMAPGAPPMESTGTMHGEATWGGRYVVEDWKGSMMGQPFEGRGVNTYNNTAKRYENTWMDNGSTGIWFSTGTCDAAGVCTYTGDGWDPISGQKMAMRSVLSWVDANTFKMEMYGPGPDGKEYRSMEIVAKKK